MSDVTKAKTDVGGTSEMPERSASRPSGQPGPQRRCDEGRREYHRATECTEKLCGFSRKRASSYRDGLSPELCARSCNVTRRTVTISPCRRWRSKLYTKPAKRSSCSS
ncbi:hypothetical protein MRX96_018436 [Rhipicephalus microplus]